LSGKRSRIDCAACAGTGADQSAPEKVPEKVIAFAATQFGALDTRDAGWTALTKVKSTGRQVRYFNNNAERVGKSAYSGKVQRRELHKFASVGPQSADLLLRRMAVLDLDEKEVSEIAPQALRELQRTCTLCANKRLCARDLARDAGSNPAWEDPNAATLMALNALPWSSRSEW
jgi:hypothetical protein